MKREALLRWPARAGAKAAPVVFVFHGHGGTLQVSELGAPVMTGIHSGAHKYLAEATALIAEFFKAQARH